MDMQKGLDSWMGDIDKDMLKYYKKSIGKATDWSPRGRNWEKYIILRKKEVKGKKKLLFFFIKIIRPPRPFMYSPVRSAE